MHFGQCKWCHFFWWNFMKTENEQESPKPRAKPGQNHLRFIFDSFLPMGFRGREGPLCQDQREGIGRGRNVVDNTFWKADEVYCHGIGITIAMVNELFAVAPVCGMPPEFDEDRHNMYKYSFAHGTDVTSAKMILPQGFFRPYTFWPCCPAPENQVSGRACCHDATSTLKMWRHL